MRGENINLALVNYISIHTSIHISYINFISYISFSTPFNIHLIQTKTHRYIKALHYTRQHTLQHTLCIIYRQTHKKNIIIQFHGQIQAEEMKRKT